MTTLLVGSSAGTLAVVANDAVITVMPVALLPNFTETVPRVPLVSCVKFRIPMKGLAGTLMGDFAEAAPVDITSVTKSPAKTKGTQTQNKIVMSANFIVGD